MTIIRQSKGSFSGWTNTSVELVRDRKSLEKMWGIHCRGVLPPPGVPEIDFSCEVMIMAFLGQQSCGGGDVGIRVEKKGADLDVSVKFIFPDDSGALSMAISCPWHMIVVPAVTGSINIREV
ncbi:MAG: hypothetical protein CVV64_04410 [Candidatus Wallbacteria bacterium HGW-Wallbacteria-1]|uniref:PrcB C-terminal domain-containing protein n=1 Tax=Candidatus Wallbacteria bacterium HGW-Wallbacteria-1 TaxID=2013854 RepID=A0A2N1PRQ0_9BACT|nr:MAG: hypothetical protein CVV64_04410 [Candidatus Wallbacteria bacterium HGW-Wallbacteria-1]